jgi:exopolysaccharide biosynthesis polyprenyl glycosylphosphotransferase
VRGPDAGLQRDSLFRRLLLLADASAIVAAYLLTVALAPAAHPSWVALAGVPLLLLGAKVTGLYDRDEALLRKTTLDEAPKLFQLATLAALLAWLGGGGVLGGGLLGRGSAVLLWMALAALLVVARAAARALALRLTPAERCLFIGDERSAEQIRAKLAGGGVNADLVAAIGFESAAPWSSDSFSQLRLAEIRYLADSLDVQRAIIAPSGADGVDLLNLVRTLKAVGVRVSVLPRLLEVVGSTVEFDDLHGVTVMGVRRFDLSRSSARVKRLFDSLGAALGLAALSPALAAIALAIKLDSRGPVFFRQTRVGRYGQRFRMFKFRTMVDGADAMKESLRGRNEACGQMFKIAEDPRVTRVGRWLRRSSLDELPQLINVIRGEMSLVGPRPLVIDEDRHVEGWHRRRLELMPGMTGHWQILGGPARVPLKEMVAIDYLYVANWSLWTDLKILLRTVPHVLARRGL